MTFFEWIRRCLLLDAKEHPFPKRFDGTAGVFVPRETQTPATAEPKES